VFVGPRLGSRRQHRSVAGAGARHRGAGRDRARERVARRKGSARCARLAKYGGVRRGARAFRPRARRSPSNAAASAPLALPPGVECRAPTPRASPPPCRSELVSGAVGKTRASAPTTTWASSRASRICRSSRARCAAARSACCSCTTPIPRSPRRRSASPTRSRRARCSRSASRARPTRRLSSRTWSCPITPPTRAGATLSPCAA
jgi:hypothetical protein